MGWGQALKFMLKATAKGAKVAAPHIKTGIKVTAQATGKTISFAAKHPKTALAGTAIALPAFGYNKGLVNFAKERALGKDEQKKGLVHAAGDLLLGSDKDANGNDKSIVEKTLDTALGDGTYSNVTRTGATVVNEVGNGYSHLRDGVSYLSHEAGSLFSGNGMVSDGNGAYYDPTSQQYPSMSQMTGQQSAGMVGSLMNGMNSAVNSISGGNVSKMNLAGLLLSAYMMFGRFGWLGKAASMMLGGMTLNSINNHRQGQAQNQRPQQQVQSALQQPSYQTAGLQGQEEDVVVRTRHL